MENVEFVLINFFNIYNKFTKDEYLQLGLQLNVICLEQLKLILNSPTVGFETGVVWGQALGTI